MRTTFLILLAAALALSACAETTDANTEAPPLEADFVVEPVISLSQNDNAQVRVERVFLSVSAIILEPLDDFSAPMLANREHQTLTFDPNQPQQLTLGKLQVPKTGRYLVSLAIAPPPQKPTRDKGTGSVELDGVYQTISKENPKGEVSWPEPVPYKPTPETDEDPQKPTPPPLPTLRELDFTMDAIPFHYRSSRTGYIRIGEVTLNPEKNHLNIHVDLDAWIDAALEPLLQEHSESSSQPLDDLSSQLESAGFGLEKLFMVSEARAH